MKFTRFEESKGTGMCIHGNWSSSCSDCRMEREEEKEQRESDRHLNEQIQQLFQPRIEFAKSSGKGQKREASRYNRMMNQLLRLTNPSERDSVSLPSVSEGVMEAFTIMAGFIETDSTETTASEQSKEDLREQEQIRQRAEEVFLESCERIYGDSLRVHVETPTTEIQKLEKTTEKFNSPIMQHVAEMTSMDTELLLETLDDSGSDSEQFIQELDVFIKEFGERIGDITWLSAEDPRHGGFTDSEYIRLRKDLVFANKIAYRALLLRNQLQERRGESRKRIETGAVEQESEPLSIEDIDRMLDTEIGSLADLERIVTPEVKNGLLDVILKAVDQRIEQGKRLDEKSEGPAGAEARTMSTILGNESGTRRWQVVPSVEAGRIMDPKEISGMRVETYLKKYFGYDLKQDKERAAGLIRYTNMID